MPKRMHDDVGPPQTKKAMMENNHPAQMGHINIAANLTNGVSAATPGFPPNVPPSFQQVSYNWEALINILDDQTVRNILLSSAYYPMHIHGSIM